MISELNFVVESVQVLHPVRADVSCVSRKFPQVIAGVDFRCEESESESQMPHPNFEKHQIQIFFEIGQELVRPAHLKAQ